MKKTEYGRKMLTLLGWSAGFFILSMGGAHVSGAEITEETAIIGGEAQAVEQNTTQNEPGREETVNAQLTEPPEQERTGPGGKAAESETARKASQKANQKSGQEIYQKVNQKAAQEANQKANQEINQKVNRKIYQEVNQEGNQKAAQGTNDVKRQKDAKVTDSVPEQVSDKNTTFHIPGEEIQEEKDDTVAKDSIQGIAKEPSSEEGMKEESVKQQKSGQQNQTEMKLLLAVAAVLLPAGVGRWMGHFLFHKW